MLLSVMLAKRVYALQTMTHTPNAPHILCANSYVIRRFIMYTRAGIVSHIFGRSHTDWLHVVTHASISALPVPMLRQVYGKW